MDYFVSILVSYGSTTTIIITEVIIIKPIFILWLYSIIIIITTAPTPNHHYHGSDTVVSFSSINAVSGFRYSPVVFIFAGRTMDAIQYKDMYVEVDMWRAAHTKSPFRSLSLDVNSSLFYFTITCKACKHQFRFQQFMSAQIPTFHVKCCPGSSLSASFVDIADGSVRFDSEEFGKEFEKGIVSKKVATLRVLGSGLEFSVKLLIGWWTISYFKDLDMFETRVSFQNCYDSIAYAVDGVSIKIQ